MSLFSVPILKCTSLFTANRQNGMISLYVNIQTGNRKAWLSNMDILKQLAEELNIRVEQVQATVQLIDEGNTIPFIARYRKEVTGSLDDEVLRNLDERLTYLRNLEEKKNQVLSSIEEQGKLTDELREQILAAKTLVVVEDLYIHTVRREEPEQQSQWRKDCSRLQT